MIDHVEHVLGEVIDGGVVRGRAKADANDAKSHVDQDARERAETAGVGAALREQHQHWAIALVVDVRDGAAIRFEGLELSHWVLSSSVMKVDSKITARACVAPSGWARTASGCAAHHAKMGT